MQNTVQKFRQSSIVFEKPGILSENLETDELQLPYRSIFFVETSHTVSTYQCLQKGVWEFFLISFRSQIICRNLKRPGFYTLVFYTFINNSRSKQNKKIPHTILQTLLSRKRVQNFSEKH